MQSKRKEKTTQDEEARKGNKNKTKQNTKDRNMEEGSLEAKLLLDLLGIIFSALIY